MAVHVSNKPDPRILSILKLLEAAALSIVAVVVTTILGLWFIPSLDAFPPPIWSQMTANAALGMGAAAAGCAFASKKSIYSKMIGRAAAGLALSIGVLSFAEYALHVSFGIDTWLPHAHVAVYPGRPSPQTSFGLALLGLSILTIDGGTRRRRVFADGLALTLVALTLVMLGGHLYGALGITGVNAVTILSPQTLLVLSCLAFVVVARRARRGGFFGVLVNAGVGSQMARAILGPAALLPLIFFVGQDFVIQKRMVSAPYAHAVGSAAASFFVLCIISWTGWRLNGLEAELREASLIDELTGIYNRRGFYFLGEQAVRDAERAVTGLTLFFFDLNGLKFVNDTFGHDAGSNMIREFSDIIKRSFRKTDIIARVGGDEFAVLAIRDGGLSRHKVLSQITLYAAEAHKADPRMQPTFSVGVTEFIHRAGDSLELMLARADALMYQDKARAKAIHSGAAVTA